MTITEFKRALLRSIYDGAKRSGASLTDALTAALVANYGDIGRGRVVTGTTVGGHSVSFTVVPSGFSPAECVVAVEQILSLVETTEGGDPAPANDAATFATVLRELQPVTEFTTDHRFGRLQETR